ncbi:MAG: DUF4340 domain-containing protein [Candidatus Latescibacterota bacterium]|jgi:hypothetical protein
MTRLVVAIAGLFVVLFLTEGYMRDQQIAQRQLESSLRPLARVSPEDVLQIGVRAADGRTWRYVRVDSSWRYPDYHDAFVQPQRIEHLLKSLLLTPASIVSSEARDFIHYGLGPTSPVLELFDREGTSLLSARLGRGVPDMRSGEAYVQRTNADTIYHLHANPAHAFDATDPPMLDRRIRPRALAQKAITQITFAGVEAHSVRRLRRELVAPAEPNMPGAPPSGPTYAWSGLFIDGERECVLGSAFAYISFLDRLTWDALQSAKDARNSFSAARRLYLEDEDGRIDTLEVASTETGLPLLRYRTTGQVFNVNQAKVDLLFPAVEALLDTLPKANAYEQAEPYTPF